MAAKIIVLNKGHQYLLYGLHLFVFLKQGLVHYLKIITNFIISHSILATELYFVFNCSINSLTGIAFVFTIYLISSRKLIYPKEKSKYNNVSFPCLNSNLSLVSTIKGSSSQV